MSEVGLIQKLIDHAFTASRDWYPGPW